MIKGLADLEKGNAQIATWRDYGLPGWVDERTLIAAVSVSGETIETRSAFATAAERGARRIALTGPGPLLSEARAANADYAEIEWGAEPRTALGYTFVALYRALQRLGALTDASSDFEPALNELEELAQAMAVESAVDENIAKQIAIELGDRIPIILSARHLLAVAMRWKTQFNENADTWATWEAAPEAGHNMVQAALSGHAVEGSLYVLALKPASLSPAVSEAIDTSLELLSENHVPNLVLDIAAPNPLGEVLSGALMGDMVTYYSAILRERDPSATANLAEMKFRLDPMSAERS
jgi:glucose/mannose-6-phosphate isomerase